MNFRNALRRLYKRSISLTQRWLRLIRLKIIAYTAAAAAVLLSQLVLIMLWSTCFFCFLAGGTVWLWAYCGNIYTALLSAAGMVLLLFILILIFRKAWISKPFQEAIIRNMP